MIHKIFFKPNLKAENCVFPIRSLRLNKLAYWQLYQNATKSYRNYNQSVKILLLLRRKIQQFTMEMYLKQKTVSLQLKYHC